MARGRTKGVRCGSGGTRLGGFGGGRSSRFGLFGACGGHDGDGDGEVMDKSTSYDLMDCAVWNVYELVGVAGAGWNEFGMVRMMT